MDGAIRPKTRVEIVGNGMRNGEVAQNWSEEKGGVHGAPLTWRVRSGCVLSGHGRPSYYDYMS